jgi:exopolysaccharide biosynthesis protein
VKRTIRRSAAVTVAALCLLGAIVAAPAGVGNAGEDVERDRTRRAPIVKKKKLAPGVTYTKIVQRQIPRRTFILRVDAAGFPATIDVALGTDALPTHRTVLEIARTNDALAAVNGDFGDLIRGRPTHPLAQDGDLVQTTDTVGPLFALSLDETTAYLGHPDLRVTISNRDTGRTWRLDRWNGGTPVPGEIAGFSPVGGTLEAPPGFACSVRLLPEGGISFDEDRTGVVRDYVVDTAGCTEEPMTREGGIVLSAPPATDEATELLAMALGTRMRLRWSLGWQGVYDAVGGMPILVQNGRNVVGPCSTAFCRANPRTGIGYTANGGVLLVVVDGRQPRWSTGVSLRAFANIMLDLGAVQALNLDGGGSTTMVVEDEVVNRPSSGQPRNLSNAVLVLPGPDPGEATAA